MVCVGTVPGVDAGEVVVSVTTCVAGAFAGVEGDAGSIAPNWSAYAFEVEAAAALAPCVSATPPEALDCASSATSPEPPPLPHAARKIAAQAQASVDFEKR